MKKIITMIFAIAMLCIVVTGCVESAEKYEARVEKTLNDAKAGFTEAIKAGDVDKAFEIMQNYSDVLDDLTAELYDLADKNISNPKTYSQTYSQIMDKARILDHVRTTDLMEMQHEYNKMFVGAVNDNYNKMLDEYNKGVAEYERVLKEYEEMMNNPEYADSYDKVMEEYQRALDEYQAFVDAYNSVK